MSNRHHTFTRFGLNVRRRREAAGLPQEALAEKVELDRTYISGIERGLVTTLFGNLIFDRANNPLIHVCDLLSFVSITALFAHERIIREIFVVQINCGVCPRLLPRAQAIENLSDVKTVES